MRVLDLSTVFAVPYLGGLLTDLGAEVIKIEPPHRLDQTRSGGFGPYAENEPGDDPWNRGGVFQVVNRGKRSFVLNLATDEGREVFRKLAAVSDIIIDNFTPRVLPGWGLHYPEMVKVKPDIIMLSNCGYGSTGPWSPYPSQGTTLEATMGITAYSGYADDKPWKIGQSYPDFITCWTGMTAVLAAVYNRRKTGQGQWIDMGMYQVGVALIPEPILQVQIDGQDWQRIGNEDRVHVPSNLFAAKGDDSWIAISVDNDEEWARLAALMGESGLASDPRFATEAARREHRDEVNQLVAVWAREQDAVALMGTLQDSGIACGPVFNARDLFLDPHLKARGFYEMVEHWQPMGTRPVIGRPYRLRNAAMRIAKAAPRFGDDNSYVLRDILKLEETEIAKLYEAQIVTDEPINKVSAGPAALDVMVRNGTLVEVDPHYRERLGLVSGDGSTGS